MNKKSTNETHALITSEHLRRRAVIYCQQFGESRASENTDAAADPRSLTDRARFYGWPASRIEIIDDHLERSGSSAETRPEWQRLQELIKAGQIGAVFVSSTSRLSHQALEFKIFRLRAAVHKTLLYMDGQFMDPANERDRILSELVARRDRWLAQQKAKAGKRDAVVPHRRSARSKPLSKSVRRQNSGRVKKQ
jgi:DNA invertase Pin-like site-specific DNA recombinase